MKLSKNFLEVLAPHFYRLLVMFGRLVLISAFSTLGLLAQEYNWALASEFGSVAENSNTTHGGVASRAIDGNTNGVWRNGSVTHTGSGNADSSWQVDLGQSRFIDRVVLFNRMDGTWLQQRLSNYRISLLDADDNVLSYQDFHTDGTTNTGESETWSVGGAFAQKVKVHLLGRNRHNHYVLSLAEVQVWGSEPDLEGVVFPLIGKAELQYLQAEDGSDGELLQTISRQMTVPANEYAGETVFPLGTFAPGTIHRLVVSCASSDSSLLAEFAVTNESTVEMITLSQHGASPIQLLNAGPGNTTNSAELALKVLQQHGDLNVTYTTQTLNSWSDVTQYSNNHYLELPETAQLTPPATAPFDPSVLDEYYTKEEVSAEFVTLENAFTQAQADTRYAPVSPSSIAIGDASNASGNNSIALGSNAQANTDNSLAIGPNAVTEGETKLAVDGDSEVLGNLNVANNLSIGRIHGEGVELTNTIDDLGVEGIALLYGPVKIGNATSIAELKFRAGADAPDAFSSLPVGSFQWASNIKITASIDNYNYNYASWEVSGSRIANLSSNYAEGVNSVFVLDHQAFGAKASKLKLFGTAAHGQITLYISYPEAITSVTDMTVKVEAFQHNFRTTSHANSVFDLVNPMPLDKPHQGDTAAYITELQSFSDLNVSHTWEGRFGINGERVKTFNGDVQFNGATSIQAQGDISMGEFQ